MKTNRFLPALLSGTIAMAVVCLAALPVAYAQPDDCPCAGAGGPAAHVDQRVRHLTDRLGLDAAQASRIRAVLEETARRAEAVHALPRGPEKRQARWDLRTRTHARVRAVLTPAQAARFDELRAERRRHRRGGRSGRGDV
ncbi:MAG: hypothetical protein HYY06_10190 [Deltaproteobacteria bacterium]|nr:hypothetical protein [Deltaproteobacteria bacterium]